jgi:hypothetical protein
VSEIFKMDCYGVVHGEAWERACQMLDVEPKRTASYEYLQKYQVGEYDRISSRVEKLLMCIIMTQKNISWK